MLGPQLLFCLSSAIWRVARETTVFQNAGYSVTQVTTPTWQGISTSQCSGATDAGYRWPVQRRGTLDAYANARADG